MEDLIVVEESCKASVDDLGRHGAVGTNVGQQEAGAKMRILLADFYASSKGLVIKGVVEGRKELDINLIGIT